MITRIRKSTTMTGRLPAVDMADLMGDGGPEFVDGEPFDRGLAREIDGRLFRTWRRT